MIRRYKTGIALFSALLSLLFLTIFSPVCVFSDQVITIEDVGGTLPVYDAVNYQVQSAIQKEDANGRTIFVSRPFGYLECTHDSQVNLSIKKTYIDRVSRDKAYIKGEIRNLDDKTIDLIVITFNLFNADGDQIGNAYASIDYLEPKKTWKYSTDAILRSDFKFERYGSVFTGVYT